jgi:hypothetical protein
MIIQLGYELVRIDIITSIKDFNFERLWANRKAGKFGEVKVNFISLDDLKRLKKKFGRLIDEADLEILNKIDKKKKTK